MIELDAKMIFEILAILGGCATTYAAIRADLARLHEKSANARERAQDAWEHAENAHKRINDL